MWPWFAVVYSATATEGINDTDVVSSSTLPKVPFLGQGKNKISRVGRLQASIIGHYFVFTVLLEFHEFTMLYVTKGYLIGRGVALDEELYLPKWY